MSTQHSRSAAKLMIAPATFFLFVWMLVPLVMTLYYSFRRYRLLSPERQGWAGFDNYINFIDNPAFWSAMGNTLLLVGGVLVITIVLGVLFALLLDMPMYGQGIVRILVIAPFFVMPTVSALVWKNFS